MSEETLLKGYAIQTGARPITENELYQASADVAALIPEEFAKENKLGMWAITFQYPWDFRKS